MLHALYTCPPSTHVRPPHMPALYACTPSTHARPLHMHAPCTCSAPELVAHLDGCEERVLGLGDALLPALPEGAHLLLQRLHLRLHRHAVMIHVDVRQALQSTVQVLRSTMSAASMTGAAQRGVCCKAVVPYPHTSQTAALVHTQASHSAASMMWQHTLRVNQHQRPRRSCQLLRCGVHASSTQPGRPPCGHIMQQG
jgi:hypothetical protein